MKSYSREQIEEIIVKNLKGDDIFSVKIDKEKVYGTIEHLYRKDFSTILKFEIFNYQNKTK